MTDREVKDDNVLLLEDGQPLVFGKQRDKGIRLNGSVPEVVKLGDVSESELVVHTEKAETPYHAFMLSRLRHPEFPEPIGVFRDVDRPRYQELLDEQTKESIAKRGPGKLSQLFSSGDTWTVK